MVHDLLAAIPTLTTILYFELKKNKIHGEPSMWRCKLALFFLVLLSNRTTKMPSENKLCHVFRKIIKNDVQVYIGAEMTHVLRNITDRALEYPRTR